MQWLRTISCLAALPMLLLMLFGIGKHEGVFEAYATWQESKALYRQELAQNDRLRAEQDTYADQIEKLQNDPLEKEWLVRSFGYIRPGEKVYKIVRSEEEPPAEANPHIGSFQDSLPR